MQNYERFRKFSPNVNLNLHFQLHIAGQPVLGILCKILSAIISILILETLNKMQINYFLTNSLKFKSTQFSFYIHHLNDSQNFFPNERVIMTFVQKHQ